MQLVRVLDFIGVGVFAVSGALAAGRKRLDVVGVVVIATVTAIGGGTLRDLLMNRTIFWFIDPAYLIAIFAAAALTMLYVRYRHPPERQLDVADAIGLAMFSISGARIAEQERLPDLIVVVIAVITGTFGGVLRDVLCNDIPMILQRGRIYASAVVAGTSLYVLVQHAGLNRDLASYGGMATIAGLRLAAIWWNLRLPIFDLEHHRGRK
ncbi:trimeric intracellular cation channel family protein [Solimonas terrae]|uniref:Trimeric intracellular cation channel family protein n=1 Tax=Solimonas terrae TaxID=1396819 RepID=A0A6M2BR24_9GAMM|nr:trimeric intracellular cation channel family protein [Solimonas terrae]NGY05092.1 trimeric intracellular cation channel family protein [Solimonas terrae]